MKTCLALLILILHTSCSTIITGTEEDIFFQSEPQGSTVEINGGNMGVTPCRISLKKKEAHSIIIKHKGYNDSFVYLNKGFEPVFLGNLILGGPIGMIVDLCSGAVYQLSPKNNFIHLTPKTMKVAEKQPSYLTYKLLF